MAENAKTQTAVIGLPMTETFLISDINAPLILSFEPIFSSLVFGRADAPMQTAFEVFGKNIMIQGLRIGDEIRVNYKPMEAIEWQNTPLSFIYDFNASESGNIIVNHGMKKYPAVRVEDSAGQLWIPARIDYQNLDTVTIGFSVRFGGKVICS